MSSKDPWFVSYRSETEFVSIRFVGGPLDGATIRTDEVPQRRVFTHQFSGRSYQYNYHREAALSYVAMLTSEQVREGVALDHEERETSPMNRPEPTKNTAGLIYFFVVSSVLLALGGWFTKMGLGTWYRELHFPSFQPPAWLFTPVWTLVLSLLAVATSRVAKAAHTNLPMAIAAFSLYGAQCILNAGWSLLFFTLQRPDMALWNLLGLDVILLLMVVLWARHQVSRLVAGSVFRVAVVCDRN